MGCWKSNPAAGEERNLPRIWLLGLAAAMILAMGLSKGALQAIFAPLVFQRDIALLDSGFFESNQSFHADMGSRKIPPQLPGPQDVWAGGEPKEIVLPLPFSTGARMTIYFLESHDSAPPVLEIIAEGADAIRVSVPKGGGRIAGLWAEEGTRSSIKVSIPAGTDGNRELIIRSGEGSWAAPERIVIRQRAHVVSIAALILAVALAWYLMFLLLREPWVRRLGQRGSAVINSFGAAISPVVSTPTRAAFVMFTIGFGAMWIARDALIPFGAQGQGKFYMLGGDEPEYMLGAYSLAHDGDLNLFNNVKSGVGKELFNLPNYPPSFHGSLKHYQKFAPAMKSTDPAKWKERQLLIHRPGASALIIPAAFIPEKMRWWSYFIISLTASALLAWAMFILMADGMRAWPILIIGGALFLSPPTIFYGSQVSPDSVFPLMAMVAALLLRRPGPARVVAASALLAALPWFSDRAIPPAFILGLAALAIAPGWRWRTACLSILGASAVGLMFYYHHRFGVPWPMYHSSRSPVSGLTAHLGLLSTLLGMDRGILFQAPIFLLAAPAFWQWGRYGRDRVLFVALGLSLLFTLALIAAAWPDNSGGVGPAGRFNMALIWLSFPALAAWVETCMRPRAAWIMAIFLAAGAAQTALLIGQPWRWFVGHHPLFTYRWAGDLVDYFPNLSIFDAESLSAAAAWGACFLLCAVACVGRQEGESAPNDTRTGE
ncbi:MAG: hypothetical protein OEZ32_07305 [Nitrospinota bacterium]|nr:hypothetical protein [Nitrospinota bacterium]